jgi:hypothetical protein
MRSLLFMLAFLFAVTGCKKSTNEIAIDYADGTGLVGKWLATERFVSPGAGGTWNVLSTDQQFVIEFGVNNSFLYTSNFPKADSVFNHYTVSSYSINMNSTLLNKQDTWYLGDTVIQNEMILSVFRCIEACPYKLRRIK